MNQNTKRHRGRRSQFQQDNWFKSYWRPAMAWLYMIICAFDFLIFPMLNAAFSEIYKVAYVQWHPITLTDGGVIHLAFGAILGVSAYTRAGERMGGYIDQYSSYGPQSSQYQSPMGYSPGYVNPGASVAYNQPAPPASSMDQTANGTPHHHVYNQA